MVNKTGNHPCGIDTELFLGDKNSHIKVDVNNMPLFFDTIFSHWIIVAQFGQPSDDVVRFLTMSNDISGGLACLTVHVISEYFG